MSVGLLALLDDVAALAKVAAASLDDIAANAAKAGAKAAGVVIDDAAVTPRYVVGFASNRELPIVGKIAWGSLRNKLLVLLPGALALSLLAPWAITPLLMFGGAFLCFEGAEKVYEALFPHAHHDEPDDPSAAGATPQSIEDERVAGAIRTDFILSAEIMAITLAAIPDGSFLMRAVILAVVGIGITAAVYGAVALIVKADDAGVAMARVKGGSVFGALSRWTGRALVLGMPVFLSVLSVIGTAAMVWVGGGIVIHGLDVYGFPALAHAIHSVAATIGHAVPVAGGFVTWLVDAAGAGIVGLALGALLIPVTQRVIAPAWKLVSRSA